MSDGLSAALISGDAEQRSEGLRRALLFCSTPQGRVGQRPKKPPKKTAHRVYRLVDLQAGLCWDALWVPVGLKSRSTDCTSLTLDNQPTMATERLRWQLKHFFPFFYSRPLFSLHPTHENLDGVRVETGREKKKSICDKSHQPLFFFLTPPKATIAFQ